MHPQLHVFGLESGGTFQELRIAILESYGPPRAVLIASFESAVAAAAAVLLQYCCSSTAAVVLQQPR